MQELGKVDQHRWISSNWQNNSETGIKVKDGIILPGLDLAPSLITGDFETLRRSLGLIRTHLLSPQDFTSHITLSYHSHVRVIWDGFLSVSHLWSSSHNLSPDLTVSQDPWLIGNYVSHHTHGDVGDHSNHSFRWYRHRHVIWLGSNWNVIKLTLHQIKIIPITNCCQLS